mmetsp:Transcript_3054/g.10554  ORF Transcript_3054/g.10554 Transcript_3054/m.10554 type:complete len:238 (-) Transcript_3054:74-787(-)
MERLLTNAQGPGSSPGPRSDSFLSLLRKGGTHSLLDAVVVVQVRLCVHLEVHGHELLLRHLRGHALGLVPGLPPRPSLEVESSGLRPHGLLLGIVALGSLLEEPVELVEGVWLLGGATGHGLEPPAQGLPRILQLRPVLVHVVVLGDDALLGVLLGLLLRGEVDLLELGLRGSVSLPVVARHGVQEVRLLDGLEEALEIVARSSDCGKGRLGVVHRAHPIALLACSRALVWCRPPSR